MRFDDVLKRCFVVVVCFMIGAAAYFQAVAIVRLAGASLDVDPRSIRSALFSLPARSKLVDPASTARESDGHATSATAILERNPFDSITGPLLGLRSAPVDEQPSTPLFGADPYADPPCDAARVLLISASEDPEWSFAAIAGDGQKPVLRRQGDEIGGRVLLAVGRDRIWLVSSQAKCQAILGAPAAVAIGGRKEPERGGGPSPDRPSAGALPPDIEGKIRRVGDRAIEIERSAVAAILERQGELFGRVRIVPEKEGDRVAGLRVLGIKPGSLLGVLGMENGDRLTKINGMEVTDPRSALEVYARLSSADHLVVSLDRRGKPMNIDVAIK